MYYEVIIIKHSIDADQHTKRSFIIYTIIKLETYSQSTIMYFAQEKLTVHIFRTNISIIFIITVCFRIILEHIT